MKSPYVAELQPNQSITATFLVQLKEVRQKPSGDPYLSLLLSDRTGELDAKMWDNATEVLDTFERDDFLRVKGLLQTHRNRLQLTVHKLQRVEANEVELADYFPVSQRKPEEMFAELQQVIAGVSNPHLRSLLDAVFADPEVARRYQIAPAAKSIHHAFLGGLLEHVLSMVALCRATAGHYRNIDVDLLLTGAIVHDIGKIYELSYDRSFQYSPDGQLLGHIILGLRLVGDHIARLPDFPPRLRTLVEHMIISHHGTLEFGSPKVPLFPEAMLLHQLDNLDSKMEAMRAHAERDRQVEGCFTGFCSSLERPVLHKERYLQPSAATSGAQPAEASKPKSAPAPAPKPSSSPFAEKLQFALRKDS